MDKPDSVRTYLHKLDYFSYALAALMLMNSNAAGAIQVVVPGTSDIWLAGMPDGSTASTGDVAPTHSPALVTGIGISPGDALAFRATGGVLHTGGCPPTCNDPDGGAFYSHSPGDLNGISDVRAPINSLMGIFLSDEQPDLSAAPAALNFEVMGINFSSLAPELKQPFFIGDGLNGSGEMQQFIVPTGATRLYLGTMDGFGWYNNSGSFTVNVLASPRCLIPSRC